MTHNELMDKLKVDPNGHFYGQPNQFAKALRAVVELHKPTRMTEKGNPICGCAFGAWTLYPCQTIQAIEKELS